MPFFCFDTLQFFREETRFGGETLALDASAQFTDSFGGLGSGLCRGNISGNGLGNRVRYRRRDGNCFGDWDCCGSGGLRGDI
jgi:hypothetical protein